MELWMFWTTLISVLIVNVVAIAVVAYFKSYSTKKGENLATHEDIQMLVDQMRAVTQATKEIEAKISNDMWSRQRRWDIKREAMFQIVKAVVGVGYTIAGTATNPLVKNTEIRTAALKELRKAVAVFWEAQMLSIIVCGEQVHLCMDNVGNALRAIVDLTMDEPCDLEIESQHRAELGKWMSQLNKAIHEEFMAD